MTREDFSALVVQYERLVYTICYQLVRDSATAEDLTQETFLSAYLHQESLPTGYEQQWLGRIAANKAKDHLQSAWNRRLRRLSDECGSLTVQYAVCACWKSAASKKPPCLWDGLSRQYTHSFPAANGCCGKNWKGAERMEVFRADGHLTDEALLLLIQEGVPEELTRLEIAEHLAFCGECLERYTRLLDAAPLLTPARSCERSLWARIRARAIQAFTSRYATAAAAATFS